MPSTPLTLRLRRCVAVVAGLTAMLAAAGPAAASDRVFWGAYQDKAIGGLNLDGSGAQTVIQGLQVGGPWGTTVDAAASRIYWADWDGGPADVIRYADLDGSDPGVLATPGATIVDPYGLTLDPTTGTLYWANETGDSINYAKTDGSGGGVLYCQSGCGAVLSVGALGMAIPAEMNDPLSPAIDPTHGRIYWANYDATLGAANLDGSGGAALITPSGCPTAIAKTYWVQVDAAAGQLYVSGRTGSVYPIQRMNLDGSGCVELGSFPWFSYGAALSPTGDSLIVADNGGDSLMRLSLGATPTASVIATEPAAIDEPAYPVVLAAPTASAAPRVTASAATIGATLTCAAPTWSIGAPGVNVYRSPASATAFSWTLGGTAIPGSAQTLVADAAGDYRCVATATNGAGRGSSVSAAVTISAPAVAAATPGRPRLRVYVSAPSTAPAGRTFTITVQVTNSATARSSATTTATDVTTCAILPGGLIVVRRNGGTLSGRTICWTRPALAAGATATYRVGLRATQRVIGPLRIRGSATADNAAGKPVTVRSATRLRVVRPKPAETVTG